MKRPVPWNDQVDVILSDESSSSDSEADGSDNKQANKDVTIDEPAEQESSEGIHIISHLVPGWLLDMFFHFHVHHNILKVLPCHNYHMRTVLYLGN